MEIIIGRKGTQRTSITDVSVSREHCKLSLNVDGTYTLENLSINGTFVDDVNVVRTIVTIDSVIRLGNSFTIAVRDLLPLSSEESKQKQYTQEFRKLKSVYDKYTEQKIFIQKESSMNNFYRMLPMTLLSLIGLGATAIPALSNIAPVIAIIGIGLLIYSLFKSYNGSAKNPEKLEALNKQFMIDYVCPKCGSTDLTKIERMNGYLSYSRVHGDTRLNDAKMAEIAERKSM